MVAAEQSVRDAATEYAITRAEWGQHCSLCLGCRVNTLCPTEWRLANAVADAQERWAAVMGRSESLPQPGPARRRAGAGPHP